MVQQPQPIPPTDEVARDGEHLGRVGRSEDGVPTADAVSRCGIVEAVRGVLATHTEASTGGKTEASTAGQALECSQHSTYIAPSTTVSPRALAAEGYPVPTEAEVAALFDRWNAALQTGDPKEVVALYAADAAVLPLLSPGLCLDEPSRFAAVAQFLPRRPWATVIERRIHRGHGIAVDTGRCTVHLALTGEDVIARYTLSYVWDGANWMITSQHCSPRRGIAGVLTRRRSG